MFTIGDLAVAGSSGATDYDISDTFSSGSSYRVWMAADASMHLSIIGISIFMAFVHCESRDRYSDLILAFYAVIL